MKIEMPWNHQHAVSADDQTLPLINVAFLLLVFFLLAGAIQPPAPLAVDDIELLAQDRDQRMVGALLMSADGRLAYGGEIIGVSDLSPTMFAELDGPLLFHVDAETHADHVIAVLRRLANVGLERVRLIGRGHAAS